MGKPIKNRKGRKVPLKFYIYADDIAELKHRGGDVDENGEFEDVEAPDDKYESYWINDYITLRFENGTTHIYIGGKRFIQCMSLVIHIPLRDVEKYDEIKSIDEAADLYKKNLYQTNIVEDLEAGPEQNFSNSISPEEEFRGHCSNIEAWAENDYNTVILHSNIAFPMLKKLTQVGDPKAKMVFKEEIAKRYEMGDKKFRHHLKILGYLKYLSEEELATLMDVVRDNTNNSRNRKLKNWENSLSSNSIDNFVTYYNKIIELYDIKKVREFLDSCTKKLIELYQDSFRNKNKPQSKKEITDLTLKRKKLHGELASLKSKIRPTGRLMEFLNNLEALIMHHDPNAIEALLDSFKIEP